MSFSMVVMVDRSRCLWRQTGLSLEGFIKGPLSDVEVHKESSVIDEGKDVRELKIKPQ